MYTGTGTISQSCCALRGNGRTHAIASCKKNQLSLSSSCLQPKIFLHQMLPSSAPALTSTSLSLVLVPPTHQPANRESIINHEEVNSIKGKFLNIMMRPKETLLGVNLLLFLDAIKVWLSPWYKLCFFGCSWFLKLSPKQNSKSAWVTLSFCFN